MNKTNISLKQLGVIFNLKTNDSKKFNDIGSD